MTFHTPERINVRGVDFDNVTMAEALSRLETALSTGGRETVFTPNAEIVQACIDDPALYAVIKEGTLIVPDGIGVIKAARILGTPLKEKVAGVDLGRALLASAAKMGRAVYFLGGKPGVAEAAAEKLSAENPGLSVAGAQHGYFAKEGAETDAVIEAVNASSAEILFVCLGAPQQETWIVQNRDRMPGVRIFLGLGGSLDVYAGTVKRAPKLFIRLGLEWFYRLCREPRRIGRMMRLPKFYFGTWKVKLTAKNNGRR